MKAQHPHASMVLMSHPSVGTIVPLPLPDSDYRELVSVLMDLSTGVDLPSTFQAVARGLSRLTSFDWLCISYRGPRDSTISMHSSHSGRPEWLAHTAELVAPPAEVETWFLPEIGRSGCPESGFVDDLRDWPVPTDIGSLLSIPMPASAGGSREAGGRARRRGALLLGRVESVPFEPRLVELLSPCAAQVTVLLEKAEWLERFRSANGELRTQLQRARASRPSGGGRADAVTIPSMPAHRPQRKAAAEARWIAVDEPSVRALEVVERAAHTDVSVVLLGESGTGKELMARTLHKLSPRAMGPFVAVNVASLTPELVGSELFGHVPGAFTGAKGGRRGLIEEAAGGTLFLDEIGDMPPSVQPALLRFLEEGVLRPVGGNEFRSVETRIVCATHRGLRAEVAMGRFRADLFHRLAEIVVELPPLRERPGDLTRLTESFLKQESGGQRRDLPADWWPAFRAHDWPGNVRELRNVVRAVVALSRGADLEARFLPEPLRGGVVEAGSSRGSSSGEFEGWTLVEVERELIRRALDATGGHRGRAAERLGISPRTLYDKVRRLDLST